MAGGNHQIAADQRMRLAGGHTDCADVFGTLGQTAVDMHRTALLGEARHLHHASPLAIKLSRLRQQRADGDDPGAAHTGDDDVMGAVDLGQVWLRQVGDGQFGGRILADLGAFQRHEGGAEPVKAREVLVALRLVNGAFAAQLGLVRDHGHAVRLHTAIAAAFANVLVDEDTLVGVREQPALAAAALLGGAGLDIDDGADALVLAVGLLHIRHLGALVDFDTLEAAEVHVFLLVIDHGEVLHAHRLQLFDDAVGVKVAFVVLTAGHRNRIVIEDLVGDVCPSRYGGPNGQHTGMVIGAVAKVLEHMLCIGERRLADPVRTLAAHMGEARGLTVHPLHHIVTADPRIGAGALWYFGR